jgi:LysM repeat protein
MRTLSALVLTAIALTGCGEYRDSTMVVPDRAGHAATDPNSTTPEGKGNTGPVVIKGKEMYITLGAQDSLSSVAKAYGVTLEWLIKRNRLEKAPQAGDNLIVPLR